MGYEGAVQTLRSPVFHCFSDQALLWPRFPSALSAPCWSCVPHRGVFVWAHSSIHSLCLLHSNTWLCPQTSDCSFPGTECSWHCLWRLWTGPSQRRYSTCYPHRNVWLRPTPAHSLEPGGLSSSSSHWRWIQRLHRRVSGTFQAALSLPQTPAIAPHTGHL